MKKMIKEYETKQNIMDALKLPKDVCGGELRVVLIGQNDARIENYKGILEYTRDHILLQGKTGKVSFLGKGMCIDYFSEDDMQIKGRIQCVRFL